MTSVVAGLSAFYPVELETKNQEQHLVRTLKAAPVFIVVITQGFSLVRG